MKQPEYQISFESFLSSFEPYLWYAFIVILITMVCLVKFFEYVIKAQKNIENQEISVFGCFLTMLAGFWNQGEVNYRFSSED